MIVFFIIQRLDQIMNFMAQIVALLTRIDAALTIIANNGGAGLSANDSQKTVDGLSSLASRIEILAGKAVADLQSVSVPSVILGGQPATGTLAMNAPGTTDTLVNLLSSDPVVQVPTSVTIPAGQTAVGFPITTTNPPTDKTVVITARNKITVTINTTVTHQ